MLKNDRIFLPFLPSILYGSSLDFIASLRTIVRPLALFPSSDERRGPKNRFVCLPREAPS